MKTGRPSGAVARAYAATSEEYPGRSTLYAGHTPSRGVPARRRRLVPHQT